MGRRLFRQFLADENGATAIEYALLGTLIAVAIVGSFTVFSEAVGNLFGAGGTPDVLARQTALIPNS